jgi:RNA polymerase sigma-70 factor (ECF subfamily)
VQHDSKETGEMRTNACQETEWVYRAIDGDPEAFALLYDSYVDQVYRYIFFRVSDSQTAEDLTSQTFLKSWENVHRYRVRESPFGAWLYQIARNVVVDYYRSRKKERIQPGAIIHTYADPNANVDEQAEKRLEIDGLLSAMCNLTEDQQQVLTLKFTAGLSTHEVAQVMGKECSAIRALQMRGLQSLQKNYSRTQAPTRYERAAVTPDVEAEVEVGCLAQASS